MLKNMTVVTVNIVSESRNSCIPIYVGKHVLFNESLELLNNFL